MKKFNREAAYKRICESVECQVIFEKYIEGGASRNDIEDLKHELPRLPGQWHLIEDESLSDKKERRKVVASKLKEMAVLIRDDPDMSRVRIWDETSIFTGETSLNKPRVSDFLDDLAAHIENMQLLPDVELFEKDRPVKPGKKIPPVVQYAIRRVYRFLCALNDLEHGPNQDTATLVNILFDLKGSERVTNNNVAKIYSGHKGARARKQNQ